MKVFVPFSEALLESPGFGELGYETLTLVPFDLEYEVLRPEDYQAEQDQQAFAAS